MGSKNIPFQKIDWSEVPRTEHRGETGTSYWQTVEFPGLRIRIVEYSPGYKADHWCEKGHFIYCLEGSFINELRDGTVTALKTGMSYIVTDKLSTHRSSTKEGAKLLIVDGGFLKFNTDMIN